MSMFVHAGPGPQVPSGGNRIAPGILRLRRIALAAEVLRYRQAAAQLAKSIAWARAGAPYVMVSPALGAAAAGPRHAGIACRHVGIDWHGQHAMTVA